MEAEIITIGTEILLGEIVDTNTRYIARKLRNLGVDIYRTTTVGDNVDRIAAAIRESAERANAIITTGGLGPTIDDPTRDGAARAFGLKTEFRPDLWEQIEERFAAFGRKPSENNKRQAYVPSGAVPISNPVGTAPGFIIEHDDSCVISLPGVPAEMKTMLSESVIPYLRKRWNLTGTIQARILRTSGLGESLLDERISDLETLSNPTVGLAAHPGHVDIRITAKAPSAEAAAQMIHEVELELRQRVGEWIYGVDDETLEQAAMRALTERGWQLAVLEVGTHGELLSSLASFKPPFSAGQLQPADQDAASLEAKLRSLMEHADAQIGLLLQLDLERTPCSLHIKELTPDGEFDLERTYGGASENAPFWAASVALNQMRRLAIETA